MAAVVLQRYLHLAAFHVLQSVEELPFECVCRRCERAMSICILATENGRAIQQTPWVAASR
jgi:hypothetical protein